MKKRYFFMLILESLTWCVLEAQTLPFQSIGKKVYVFEDKSANLSLMQILEPEQQDQFQPSKLEVPNFKTLGAAGWIKIKLKVPEGEKYYLQVGYSLLYELDLYALKGDSLLYSQKAGTKYPFTDRDILSTDFYFLLNPEADTYYLRATSIEILQLPLTVGRVEDLFEKNLTYTLLDGIYFGFVILIILYNLFLYLSTKEKVYGSYVLYVTAVGLVTSNLEGYNFQYLYPQWETISYYTPIFYPLNFFVLLFAMDFLNIKEKAPRYAKGFWVLVWICLAEIVLALVGYPALMFQISQGVGLLVVGYILWVASVLYRRGYRPAKFFLLAFTMFLLGIAITIMLSSGVIEYSFWAYHSIQIGSAFEIVLLSFAIADKINIYKREKEQAQNLALERLEENQRIIREQNTELEKKVRERTFEIEAQNEELIQKQDEILAQSQILEKQNHLLISKDKTIIDSINYAKKIQQSALGKPELVSDDLKELMIFYQPRDIVSGDFYWFSKVGSKILVVVVDCSGHGVPGALMTMITAAFLEDIVNRRSIVSPDKIIEELDTMVFKTLNQKDSNNQDGMDAGVCLIDAQEKRILFAGAKIDLIYFQDAEPNKIDSERIFIGGSQFKRVDKIKLNELLVSKPTRFFLFTDGYADQFGSSGLKRFGSKRFKDLLAEVHHLGANLQYELIEQRLQSWMKEGKNEKQTDDILILGFEV
jgi:serine phosphatase RsbU (regulator of sigma subunit)